MNIPVKNAASKRRLTWVIFVLSHAQTAITVFFGDSRSHEARFHSRYLPYSSFLVILRIGGALRKESSAKGLTLKTESSVAFLLTDESFVTTAMTAVIRAQPNDFKLVEHGWAEEKRRTNMYFGDFDLF